MSGGPTGDEEVIELNGTVESIADELWVVGGMSFVVAAFTDFEGDPQLGDFVEVEYFERSDGSLQAIKIDAEDDDGPDDDSDGDDDDGESDQSSNDQQRWARNGGSREADGDSDRDRDEGRDGDREGHR